MDTTREENKLLFLCSEAVESNVVKLETSYKVTLTHTLSVLWINMSTWHRQLEAVQTEILRTMRRVFKVNLKRSICCCFLLSPSSRAFGNIWQHCMTRSFINHGDKLRRFLRLIKSVFVFFFGNFLFLSLRLDREIENNLSDRNFAEKSCFRKRFLVTISRVRF